MLSNVQCIYRYMYYTSCVQWPVVYCDSPFVAAKHQEKTEEDSGDAPSSGKGRPRRRAVKNVSKSAYVVDEKEEALDSPASEGEVGGRGRMRKRKRKAAEMKIPRMKIKLIGHSDETDSPIFFAQSLEEVSANVQYNILL